MSAELPASTQVGPDGFITEAGIRAVVEQSPRRGPGEIVRESLLIFSTSDQRTWLVTTSGQLFCILDSATNRGSGQLIQWQMPLKSADPIKAKETKETAGQVDIGVRRYWYYSRRLFPTPSDLEEEIRRLVARAGAPRVFISYSHDSPEHADRVLELANRLRTDGVDAIIDQYEPHPAEGWPVWMERQIEDADFVMMVCTETYHRRLTRAETPGVGQGVSWEGNLIYQHLYSNRSESKRFVPVLLSAEDAPYIALPLRGQAHYRIDTEEGYEGLYRRLTRQPRVAKPELGELQPLPQRPRMHDFTPDRVRRSGGRPEPEGPAGDALSRLVAPAALGPLSTHGRAELFQRLSALPEIQLNVVVFALNPPRGLVPPPAAGQGQRVAALLEWAEATGGCGLAAVQEVLKGLLGAEPSDTPGGADADSAAPQVPEKAEAKEQPAGDQGGIRAAAAQRWVIVTGSEEEGDVSDPARWACKAIGHRLAREGYGLVLRRPDGADGLVAESFQMTLRPLGRPLSGFLREVVHQGNGPKYTVAQSEEVPHGTTRFIPAMRWAHAVIIIAGGDATQLSWERATQEQKPVLPISGTGGTAERMHEEVLRDWDSRPAPLGCLSRLEFRQLDLPIRSPEDADEVAGTVIELLRKVLDVSR